MPEKDLMQSLTIGGGWFACLLAVWGGVASFIRKVREGMRPSLSELIGEIVVSGFCGTLTFLLCQAYAVNPYLAGAIAGISGHMGSRAIALGEQYFERACTKILGPAE
jgi:hypothetical protein